ncbi:MAG: DUF1043 family protein [Alteromonadaceae bacterium]|nr:DUF1043 family protein [Alteromonadaceae bacterium]
MNIIVGIIIFIVGGIAGFIINKALSASPKEHKKLAEQASQSEKDLAQYKLDVSKHLDSSTKLLEQMNSTCQTAMKQMAQSTNLLQQATTTESIHMPFFSKETHEQLADTINLRHQKKTAITSESNTEAPLDYSDNPSGLFDGKKQSVTNVE